MSSEPDKQNIRDMLLVCCKQGPTTVIKEREREKREKERVCTFEKERVYVESCAEFVHNRIKCGCEKCQYGMHICIIQVCI